MPGRLFVQSAAVLFERAPSLEEVRASLEGIEARRREASGAPGSWIGGSASLVVPMRPEVNGSVLVDVMDAPWPDDMGGEDEDPARSELFMAWATGWFGPLVFPGALERAVRGASVRGEVAALVERHRAAVRVRASYSIGAGGDDPVTPEDRDLAAELGLVTRLSKSVLGLPGALCYFNPNGETLHDAAGLARELERCEGEAILPVTVWSAVRLFHPELSERWCLMDTVGMEQLEVVDHEACVPPEGYELTDVAGFLRSSTLYVAEHGPVIASGEALDGPGGVPWQAVAFEESLAPRPRPVLRWRPLDGEPPPPCFGFSGARR